jgi:hypothetical protein
MPYPVSTPDVTMQPGLTLNSSLQPDQTTTLSENMNQTEQQTDLPIATQTILAGATIPVAGRLLSNQSIE